MAFVFNHMPAEIYADKKLSSTAKLVMQRIFTLSKDGAQPVFFSRDKFSVDLGITQRSLSKTFKDLIEAGYLEPVKNKNPFDRTRTFNVAKNALFTEKEESSRSTEKNLQDRQGNSCKVEEERVSTSDREESSRSTEKNLQDLHQIDQKERKGDLVERDSSASSPSLFDSVFNSMKEINESEFKTKGIEFLEDDIRTDALSYTLKFNGKQTKDSMRSWMIQGRERREEYRQRQKANSRDTEPKKREPPETIDPKEVRARYEEWKKQYM